jgi:hypothetical protein
MRKKPSTKSLLDAYQFSGFKTSKAAKGKFGDKNALVLSLARRSKKVSAPNAANPIGVGMTERPGWFAIFHVVIDACILRLKPVDCYARRPV